MRWRRLVDGGGGRFSVGGSGGEGCRGERGGGGDGGVGGGGGGGGGEHKIRRTCLVHSLGGMCPCSVHVDLHPRHPLSLSVPPLASVAPPRPTWYTRHFVVPPSRSFVRVCTPSTSSRVARQSCRDITLRSVIDRRFRTGQQPAR